MAGGPSGDEIGSAINSDIVDAVLYLQNATFVTGENLRVDGGVHAGR
jgi:NAD(P)-dependent dehydrogenase (short-subunit alcohol dehydrogenase family)